MLSLAGPLGRPSLVISLIGICLYLSSCLKLGKCATTILSKWNLKDEKKALYVNYLAQIVFIARKIVTSLHSSTEEGDEQTISKLPQDDNNYSLRLSQHIHRWTPHPVTILNQKTQTKSALWSKFIRRLEFFHHRVWNERARNMVLVGRKGSMPTNLFIYIFLIRGNTSYLGTKGSKPKTCFDIFPYICLTPILTKKYFIWRTCHIFRVWFNLRNFWGKAVVKGYSLGFYIHCLDVEYTCKGRIYKFQDSEYQS